VAFEHCFQSYIYLTLPSVCAAALLILSRVASQPAFGRPNSFLTNLSKVSSIQQQPTTQIKKPPRGRLFLFEWWGVRGSNARPPD